MYFNLNFAQSMNQLIKPDASNVSITLSGGPTGLHPTAVDWTSADVLKLSTNEDSSPSWYTQDLTIEILADPVNLETISGFNYSLPFVLND